MCFPAAWVLVSLGWIASSAESEPRFLSVSDTDVVAMLAGAEPWDNGAVRELALRLGLPPGASTYPAAERRALVELLIGNVDNNSNRRIREGCAAALSLVGTSRLADTDLVAEHMRRTLRQGSPERRWIIRQYLGDLPRFDRSTEAVAAISSVLSNEELVRPDASREVERAALFALGAMGEASVPNLIGYMPRNGIDAARAIAETGSWSGFRFLRKEALRRDNRHRWACTSALLYWAEKQPADSPARAKAVRTLQRLGCDGDPRIKQTALSLLAKLGASAPAHCPAEDDDEDEGHDEGDHDGDRERTERDDRPRGRSAKDAPGGKPRH